MRAAMNRAVTAVMVCLALSALAAAQDLAQFEAVSIKRHADRFETSSSTRSLPDGSFVMTNQPIRSILAGAAAIQVREIVGAPEWVELDRYDIDAKAPAGAAPRQSREMMRRMLIDRFKLVSHVEQRERDGFALLVARTDGRLGSNLKPSAAECLPRPPGTAPPPGEKPPDPPVSCGGSFGAGAIRYGAVTMDLLAQMFTGQVGGIVINRTGLNGFFTVDLKFLPDSLASEKRGDDLPQFATAVQEQLGLKLQREKVMVPVLVIDSIERPSEN